MEKVVVVDLSRKTIEEQAYEYSPDLDYGRGLALKLLKQYSKPGCGKLDEGSALVFTTGILTGNQIPCATRAIVMAKGEGKRGLLVSNFTGDVPQKLASLGIAGIVIKGKAQDRNAILYFDKKQICFLDIPELKEMNVPQKVEEIRTRFGKETAIWGTGKAAAMLLPTATYFVTYPEGTPRFSCPRNGFGDVAGSKGLSAIIVKESNYFAAPCANVTGVQQCGKEIGKMIVHNEICGGALPGLGSMTLLHLLKDKKELPPIEKVQEAKKLQKTDGKRINTCCAPMCIIGCLNRHSSNSGDVYGAPAEAEVKAALEHRFNDDSSLFAKELNAKGFALGLDTVEFVNTAAAYLKSANIEYKQEFLMNLLDEIDKGTILGRIIGGGTEAVSALYKERDDLQKMITKPAVSREEEVRVKLNRFYTEMNDVEDMQLLYHQVFLLENLGICIFTSFALLNNQEALEVLAKAVSEKLGREVSIQNLLEYAKVCVERENEYQRANAAQSIQRSIPEFIKVLYSYFEV